MFILVDVNPEDIGQRFRSLSAFLDERMRRLVAAAESAAIGYGGVSVVARATGVSRRAITEGMKELSQPKVSQEPPATQFRIRRKGAGRKSAVDKDPGLCEDLDRLVDPVTRGTRSLPLAGPARACECWRRNFSARVMLSVIKPWRNCSMRWNYSLQANQKKLGVRSANG